MRSSYLAALSHTGQVHVGFFSFIIRNSEASKHWGGGEVSRSNEKSISYVVT